METARQLVKRLSFREIVRAIEARDAKMRRQAMEEAAQIVEDAGLASRGDQSVIADMIRAASHQERGTGEG
jgi:hypothetical protein